MFNSPRTWIPAAALAGLTAFAACDQTPVSLPEPTAIVVPAEALTIYPGGRTQLTAQVLDQDSMAIADVAASWTSSDPSVAAINNAFVTGVTPGSAVLIASYGSLADSVQITVLNDDRQYLGSFEFLESEPSADLGEGSDELEFRAFDGHGDPMCGSGFAAQGTSSDDSIAEVTGVDTFSCTVSLQLNAAGTATITLTGDDGVSADTEFTVTSDASSARLPADPAGLGAAGRE